MISRNNGEDKVLWNQFKAGNQEAYARIYQENFSKLYTYGLKITKEVNIVEDAIQDLFVKLWRSRQNLTVPDAITPYLFLSLRRLIIRQLNTFSGQHAIINEHYDFQMEISPETSMIQKQLSEERRQQLQQALSQLSPRQREAIFLKFYDKMSYEEIATVMSLNVNSVYNLISKAIDALQQRVPAPLERHLAVICNLLFLFLFS